MIAGKCETWEQYEARIRYPELFELRIYRVENEDIPDLFEEADYFVAPYQDIAQSGSSVVAVNYGIPLIASKLPAFEEYVENGRTGWLIDPANVVSLERVMEEIITSDNAGYEQLVNNLAKKRQELFAKDTIIKKYQELIDVVIREKNLTSTGNKG